MKAVNMKNYKFGTGIKWGYSKGFGIYDEETKTFASMDGKTPYVLGTKKLVESCIFAGWQETVCKYRVPHN